MAQRTKPPAKLPVQQLTILAICRFSEPVVLTSVYPYIPEMIESFGIPAPLIAKWAGITSAVFSLAQSLTGILWGRVSDTFGRKPAIIASLTLTMLTSIVWGCSTSLPMAITTRTLQGAFNGNVGTIRTTVAEMVTEKELQPLAFSIMPLVWSLGSIFGPSFGGFFAKPTEHMPKLFGGFWFFEHFPFVLPNLIAACFFIIGILTAILFLEETLESKKHTHDPGLVLGQKLILSAKRLFRFSSTILKDPTPNESTPLIYSNSSSSNCSSSLSSIPDHKVLHTKSLTRPTFAEVLTCQSILNLVTYTFLALHSVSYDQLLPIFMHRAPSPPPTLTHFSLIPLKFSGGFGIDSSRIGTLLTIYGILGCFVQFAIFPRVARKWGVLKCFKCCGIAFPIVYFITPYTALIQEPFYQQATMLAIMTIKCFAVIFAFPCSVILLTNSASSLLILGTLNGMAVSVSGFGRAIGPVVTGVAFTWGEDTGYGIIPWWLLGVIAVTGAVPIWWLVEGEGFTKNEKDDEDEDHIGEHIDGEEPRSRGGEREELVGSSR